MIFTIGYSNNNIKTFISKLREYKINLVIDVRSKPYSRNPQFNKNYLEKYLNNNGLDYLYMGDYLGGLEISPNINKGIERVIKLSQTENLVLMCVEKDLQKCHRYRLLTPLIENRNNKVIHLL